MGRRADDGGSDLLERAVEVGARAAARGFDWPDVEGPLAKIEEERGELTVAVRSGDSGAIEAELGDLLFAAVNLARHAGVSPSRALAGTLGRFEERWAFVQARAAGAGVAVEEASLEQLEGWWQEAKRVLAARAGQSGTKP